MVQYADFYVFVGTLSPAFLFAALIAHQRLARRPGERGVGWVLLLVAVLVTMFEISNALATLAAFQPESADNRFRMMIAFVFQLSVSIVAIGLDTIRKE